jgi:hypothetical protein
MSSNRAFAGGPSTLSMNYFAAAAAGAEQREIRHINGRIQAAMIYTTYKGVHMRSVYIGIFLFAFMVSWAQPQRKTKAGAPQSNPPAVTTTAVPAQDTKRPDDGAMGESEFWMHLQRLDTTDVGFYLKESDPSTVNARIQGKTPLGWVLNISNKDDQAKLKRRMTMLRMLLSAGADVNKDVEQLQSWDTPVARKPLYLAIFTQNGYFEAINSHRMEIISLLIQKGADVRAQGAPLLFAACTEVDEDHCKDDYSHVRNRYICAVAERLLANGADAKAENSEGRTVLDYAKHVDASEEMIALLERYQ